MSGEPVKIVGEPYQGPTVPTFRVNKAIKEQPAKDIPLATMAGDAYHNADVGVQYNFPEGWQALPPERNDPSPRMHRGNTSFYMPVPKRWCGWFRKPAAGKSYREGPMIVLRALDYNCLSMRTPIMLGEKRALDETAAALEQSGEFGQIDTDQLKLSRVICSWSSTVPWAWMFAAKTWRSASRRRSTPRASTSSCWYGRLWRPRPGAWSRSLPAASCCRGCRHRVTQGFTRAELKHE